MKSQLIAFTVALLTLSSSPVIAHRRFAVCFSCRSSSSSSPGDDVNRDNCDMTLPLNSGMTQIRGGGTDFTDSGNNYYPQSQPPPPPPPPPSTPSRPCDSKATSWNSDRGASYPNQKTQAVVSAVTQDSPVHPPLPDDNEVRARFLRATKGDPVEAHKRYMETMEWRRQERMDDILKEPHPKFDVIKRNYPHYFHLRGKNNEPVYYESPPKMNLDALRAAGVTLDDLLRHYALVTEFMWTHVEQSQQSKSIYIIDLDGMRLRDFFGDVVKFVKAAAKFTGAHYPERSGTVFVINVPSFFSVIYNVVKPFVDPVTLAKVQILRGKENIRKALAEKIPVENIPPNYGGTSVPLGLSPEERCLRELMVHYNCSE